MITKELFVETIEAIRLQYEHDEKWSSSIGKLFPNAFDANLGYDNHFANNALLKLLQVQLKDDVSWIEYFMHELEFGKTYKDGDAMDENGQVIDLSDSGKLYDFLQRESIKKAIASLGKKSYVKKDTPYLYSLTVK